MGGHSGAVPPTRTWCPPQMKRERCCVHNMSPFIPSSGLSPGSREAKVQWADRRYLSDRALQGLGGDPREMNCKQYVRIAADVY